MRMIKRERKREVVRGRREGVARDRAEGENSISNRFHVYKVEIYKLLEETMIPICNLILVLSIDKHVGEKLMF